MTRQEFTVAATNPKAIVLFAALLPQFLRGGPGGATLALVVLGAVYNVVEAVCALFYSFLGARLRRIDITPARDRLIQRVAGTSLIGFAVYLAATARAVTR